MTVRRYSYDGPIDHEVATQVKNIRGKSVILTGGANGIGEACVRDLVAAGAFVTFCDLDKTRGKLIEDELNQHGVKCAFVECNITDWDQQKAVFDTAKSKSPHNSVDVVIANAGISRSSGDSLWNLTDPDADPVKPDLNIVNVNITGTLYTFKLAVHYFRKQPLSEERDRCFVMTGSLVSFIDSPGNWEYTVSKCGLKGLMKTVRRNSHEQGIRINYVAPCYIASAIRSPEYEEWLINKGVEFASQTDVSNCMMRIACDKTINGKALMITPQRIAKAGFMDIDRDDYKDDKAEDAYFKEVQTNQLIIIEDEWRDDYTVRTFKH